MKKLIIFIIIFLLFIAYLFFLVITQAGGGPADYGAIEIKPIKLTIKEAALKDKIVIQKQETMTVNEWREELPSLLEKMKKQAGLTDAEYLNLCFQNKEDASLIIRALDKKLK